ncbi:MAG: preQ(1) synthase [Candidatus Saliniplasma sp.]
MISTELEIIDNKYSDKEYKVKIICPEFTCLCPGKRDQPDFATITITYIPKDHLIELKSLKYYIVDYRDVEIFHEEATNKILNDLVKAVKPRYMSVRSDWNVRGGITTIVETEYSAKDWEGDPKKIEIKDFKNTASKGGSC